MNNTKTSFSSLIEKLDLFGISYNFQLDNQEKYKTLKGGLISIMFYLITLILFIGFGQNLYERKNPKVSLSSMIGDYERTSINNKNFTLAFRIENYDGLQLNNNSIAFSEVVFRHYEMGADGQMTLQNKVKNQSLTYRKCSEMEDTPEKERRYNISLQTWNCINFNNFTFGGFWDGKFIYSITISTKPCTTKSLSSNLNDEKDLKCVQFDQLRKEFLGANIWYSYLFMESSPVMDNFEKPIQTYFKNNYEFLNLKLHKRTIQTFKTVLMDNDVGWLFMDVEKIKYISNDNIQKDIGLREEEDDENLYTHMVYLGNKRDNYNRSYLKVQELLANVGGFSKLLLTIMQVVFFLISDRAKNLLILERLNYVRNEINDVDYFENKNNVSKNEPDNKNHPLNQIDGKENIFSTKINADKTRNKERTLSKHKKDSSETKTCKTEMSKKNRFHKVNTNDPYLNQNKNNNSCNNCIDDFRIKKDVLKTNTSKMEIIEVPENSNKDDYKNNNNDDENINQEINTLNDNNEKVRSSSKSVKLDNPLHSNLKEEISLERENLDANNIEQQQVQRTYKLQDENKEINLNSGRRSIINENNHEKSFINLSVVRLIAKEISSLCCGGKRPRRKGKLDETIRSNIKSLEDPKIISNQNAISKNPHGEISEFKIFNEREKGYYLNLNESNKNLKDYQVKNSHEYNSSDSNEEFIYDNYFIYEMNINKMFDVFSYLNIVKDMKNLKAILLGNRGKLFDLIKPNLEINPNDFKVKAADDDFSNNIFENLKKILKEQALSR